MRKFKNLLMVVVLCTSATIFAQTKLTGKVVDETSQPLPGASIVVKGSSTGVSTDFDGNFTLETSDSSGTILVSFVGYEAKNLTFNGSKNFGSIALNPSAESLEEIIITATSFAIDRKTPVAVSTVKAEVIENKLGSQEFPEILKSTPGVYATKSGGGFGDGRLTLRGFNSENVAVMINGVPVNDMENGRVYWSNWAGLADVTSAMQVQRGLGASKLAVPSIGGTVNILSKTTDVEKGGNIFTAVGNDGYQKYGATVSTGLLDNGFAATVSASKTKGDGYVDGTQFEGYNYFVNISKQINDNHKIALTSFGAPQWHGQRQNQSLISTYRNAESGIKFNPNWGLRDGNVVNVEDNFYHKSQTSLNHYWTISDKTNVSTALYASWGTGGGGGTAGNTSLFQQRIGGDDQPIDIDNIVAINRANGSLGAEAYLRASRNDHSWFGVLSTLKTDLNENVSLIAGVDIRDYTGKHFSEVTDLLGADYALDNSNVNNPNAALKVGDKRDYWNDGEVGWQGLFTQLEYDRDNVAGFISAAVSNTSYKRIDYFQYLPGNQETDKYNFTGFSVKGGANYNINDQHNVFANVGYFEKAPGFDAVFLQFDNDHINADAENQKIFSTELGYGFRGATFAANVNIYRTEWKDRTLTRGFQNPDGSFNSANILGVNAIHQGAEFDFTYRPGNKLSIIGMLSLGDWTWDNDVTNVQIFDEEQNLVQTVDLFIAGLKVSDAAQTTASLGFDYELMDKTNFTVDFNYFADLYARYDPNSRGSVGPQAWKAPNYTTFDMSVRHGFKIGDLDATLIGRMNNVFDTQYIADATDGNGSVDETALVWYGYGRTFNVSAKIKF
ncbi:outer membrane receptor protein involved in Fe transport [Lutibacter oceani]|uniref:Outer membrane receptor protein involved in Fe transport n=1 Tax=Lutibacter oceani TaxID=1853311 RepID=A0A3D9RU70_9FLAO|nr:TonB-dependent receptor [Lutibacter oceani]REE83509.1 outer membrane receptor protein involved in Fe transport [Lutibacter oceani]